MPQPLNDQDIALLKDHLRAIVAVESLTVPLYLTAVYSFTQRALDFEENGSYPLYDLQQKALSVAVQEMYHLQLACNLCNAFDVTPEIPGWRIEAGTAFDVPHITGERGEPIRCSLGNLPQMLTALILLETPEQGAYPPPNAEVRYPSIAALYHATLTLLSGYMRAYRMTATEMDPHFWPNNKQVAYATFASTYRFNKIVSRPLVPIVASAITDQGEGNVVASQVGGDFRSGTEDDVLPEFQPRPGTRFAAYGKETHFTRLREIESALAGAAWEAKIGGPVFHAADGKKSPDLPSWAAPAAVLRDAVSTLYSYLTEVMAVGFRDGTLSAGAARPGAPAFGDAMLSFKYLLPQTWQYGEAPSFLYRPGVQPGEVQKAMDAVDPLCLFHWDARSAAVRAAGGHLNACQGLNECSGKGWGGVATGPGNGACATANLHTCGANNSCSLQGGCGYLVSRTGEACGSGPVGELFPPSELWIPGSNSCHGHGGCQTPISTEQAFNSLAGTNIDAQTGPDWTPEAKAHLKALMGKNVWDHARELFGQRARTAKLPDPIVTTEDGIRYDGAARRAAVAPTSK